MHFTLSFEDFLTLIPSLDQTKCDNYLVRSIKHPPFFNLLVVTFGRDWRPKVFVTKENRQDVNRMETWVIQDQEQEKKV